MSEPKVDHLERAARAWPILARVAGSHTKIRYGELAGFLRMHHRPLRYMLSKIQDYCMYEGLPPLTILVVDRRGRPGSGFIAWDAANLQGGFDAVYAKAWEELPNPFSFPGSSISEDQLVQELQNPVNAADVYSLVKTRGVGQILFRQALGRAYGGACAFTGSRISDGLEAAHIVPWAVATPADRLNVRNGLLVTVWHHRLFDRGIISLAEDYRINIEDPPKARTEIDDKLLWSLHDKRLRLPRNRDLWPDPRLIIRRNAAYK